MSNGSEGATGDAGGVDPVKTEPGQAAEGGDKNEAPPDGKVVASEEIT